MTDLQSAPISTSGLDGGRLRPCHCCGLVQWVPPLKPNQVAQCLRCQTQIDHGRRDGRQSSARCLAAAIAALILYFPAVLLPILEIEKLGHRYTTSLLSGTIELILHDNLLVGLIVLVFSIITPLVKLLALIELSYVGASRREVRAWMYRLVEWAGRWSMLDVLLLALLVALVKLGDLVTFRIGPAVVAFALCVALSMIASAVYDPHAMWDDGGDR